MAVPPKPILTAIRRWLKLAPQIGWVRARSLLTNVSEYSDLTPTQYAEARYWIIRNLGDEVADFSLSNLEIFSRIIEASQPVWLRDAETLIDSEEELPHDALVVAKTFSIPEKATVGEIRRLGRKIDTDLLKKVGDHGEYEILKLLQVRRPFQVDHVAAWSDSHGYDIAVIGPQKNLYLEVKASTRVNRRVFYLSRNEYEVMRWMEGWKLIFVHLNDSHQFRGVFEVNQDWVEEMTPKDVSISGRWESVRYEVPNEAIFPGISGLENILVDPNSQLLHPGK